jgi:hypothetical protein
MHTVGHHTTRLRGASTFQTFVPLSEAYPISLSVLWRPVPKLTADLLDSATATLSMFLLSKPRIADDIDDALIDFLLETRSREQLLTARYINDVRSSLEREPDLRWALNELLPYKTSLDEIPAVSISNHRRALLRLPVVVSKSPPAEEMLAKLLSTGTIGIGVYTGWSIVPSEAHPLLLISCVVGGIICISTAAGIGRALQDGLYERLYRLLSGDGESGGKKKTDR